MSMEVTDEMIEAFWAGHDDAEDGGTERGLATVLAIVGRDYYTRPYCNNGSGFGPLCKRYARHDEEHVGAMPSGTEVQWSDVPA